MRKDIKEHLSPYASKGYVDKVMDNMGEDIIINILWCPSCNETGTYSDKGIENAIRKAVFEKFIDIMEHVSVEE